MKDIIRQRIVSALPIVILHVKKENVLSRENANVIRVSVANIVLVRVPSARGVSVVRKSAIVRMGRIVIRNLATVFVRVDSVENDARRSVHVTNGDPIVSNRVRVKMVENVIERGNVCVRMDGAESFV